jgi:hypothetical protein
MERRTVGVVEPIARVEGQQLNLGAFGQRGRLIQHQPAGAAAREGGGATGKSGLAAPTLLA